MPSANSKAVSIESASVVDRLVVKDGIEGRLADSMETALELAEGNLTVDVIGGDEMKFSENHACPICGFSIGELEYKIISFCRSVNFLKGLSILIL